MKPIRLTVHIQLCILSQKLKHGSEKGQQSRTVFHLLEIKNQEWKKNK